MEDAHLLAGSLRQGGAHPPYVDQGFQVIALGIAAGLSRLGHDVTYIEYGRAALPDGLQDLRDEKVRQDARIKAARS